MDNEKKIKAVVDEGIKAIKRHDWLYNYINSEDTKKEIHLGDEFREYIRDAANTLRSKRDERELAIDRDIGIARAPVGMYPPSDVKMAKDRTERNEKGINKINKAIRLASKLSRVDSNVIEVDTNKLSKKDEKKLPLIVEINSTGKDLSIVSIDIKSIIDSITKMGVFRLLESNLKALSDKPKERHPRMNIGHKGLQTIALLLGMSKFVTIPNKYTKTCEQYISEIITDRDIKKTSIQIAVENLLDQIFEEYLPSVLNNMKMDSSSSQKEKVGKIIRLLSPESDNSSIETLVSALTEIHSLVYSYTDNSFEIVHGDSIPYFYNSFNNTYVEKLPGGRIREGIDTEDEGEDILDMEENFNIKGGVLASSCMRHNNNYKELSFYANNPDKIGMLILRGAEKNKIIGRAIVWYPGDGNTYVDRIYSISERIENLFRSYISKNNMIGIHTSSSMGGSKNKYKFFIDELNPPTADAPELPYLDSLNKVCKYATRDGHLYIVLGYRIDTKSSELDFLEEKAKDSNVKVIGQTSLGTITRDSIKDKLLKRGDTIEDHIKPDYSSNVKSKIDIKQKILSLKEPREFRRGQYLVGMKGCISPKPLSPITPFENYDESKVFIYHVPSLISNRRVMNKLLIDDCVDFVHSRHVNFAGYKGIWIIVSTGNVYKIFGKKNVKRIGSDRFEYLPGKEKCTNKTKKNNRPQGKHEDTMWMDYSKFKKYTTTIEDYDYPGAVYINTAA